MENSNLNELISPITLKIMIDYARRALQTMSYSVVDIEGRELFETNNVRKFLDFYQPADTRLNKVLNFEPSSNKVKLKTKNTLKQLKSQAIEGSYRNFPTYDSASSYGSAVITEDGFMYCSGQYSSYEHRTNIHSEMGAVIAALMDAKRKISDIGLVSTKYLSEPCQMCGSCRQFLAEISARFHLDLKIHLFALESEQYETYKLSEYLPKSWESKQW